MLVRVLRCLFVCSVLFLEKFISPFFFSHVMQEISFSKPKVHVFVCINDRSNKGSGAMPSCGPRITGDHVKQLKQWIRERGLTQIVYCTKTQCLGFCNAESSVVCVYPSGRFVKGIQTIEDVKQLILEEVEKIK